ncbi:LANO_0F16248g1_1 [Lachancea nothofagi CBS 11611]|uniref:LANO_0F16248g1_1 n=1 Tax=Lachancea nothofagi CBS 11611 TaxID=1266666 RepID=A0A1G4KCV7_9SACH|nr:LANO_0F16248g1_1 [Lachancea nothofagi CBS 11611]
MEDVKKKWKELLYSFSTSDRYADYNENSGVSGVSSISRRSAGSPANAAASSSQIQLTEFVEGQDGSSNDGVSETMLAWRHIDAWASEHHSDLYATLSEPCTRSDISRAEQDLSIVFPASVRASFRFHDGQEDLDSLTGTSGLIFGLQLMPMDQVVHMTQTWRNVAFNMLKHQKSAHSTTTGSTTESEIHISTPNKSATPQNLKSKGYRKLESQDSKGSNPALQRDISHNYNKQFKMNSIPQQRSIPPEAIQSLYVSPGWIPLVTDNAGNHIAIDLAPGPKGVYGQIILFGREFDTKFVVANNWGDFLLNFANDLEKGNWYIMDGDDDYLSGAGDLVFRDKNAGNTIKEYFEVLKLRSHGAWRNREKEQTSEGAVSTSVPVEHKSAVSSQATDSSFPLKEQETMVAESSIATEDQSTSEKKPDRVTVVDSLANSTETFLASEEPSPEAPKQSQKAEQKLQVNEHPIDKEDHEQKISKDEGHTSKTLETENAEEQKSMSEEKKTDSQTQNPAEEAEEAKVKELTEEFDNVAL